MNPPTVPGASQPTSVVVFEQQVHGPHSTGAIEWSNLVDVWTLAVAGSTTIKDVRNRIAADRMHPPHKILVFLHDEQAPSEESCVCLGLEQHKHRLLERVSLHQTDLVFLSVFRAPCSWAGDQELDELLERLGDHTPPWADEQLPRECWNCGRSLFSTPGRAVLRICQGRPSHEDCLPASRETELQSLVLAGNEDAEV